MRISFAHVNDISNNYYKIPHTIHHEFPIKSCIHVESEIHDQAASIYPSI